MSLAVLNQVYDEMRRIAIAGSVVAPGDFRLKKLVAPLQQSGAKAPIFARVADAVNKVIESNEKTSADALLELSTLVNAILYTQGETGATGPLEPIETINLGIPSTQTSARMLKPLLEALTTTGAGRLETIREAHERGLFRDIRLIKAAVAAIDDPYGEIGDIVAEKILPMYGKTIVPELRAKLDLKGKGGHPRRLQLLHKLDPEATRELVEKALEEGSVDIRVVAIGCLGKDDLSYLIEQASAKAQDVRRAAYSALAKIDDTTAIEVLEKAAKGKDLELVSPYLLQCQSKRLVTFLIGEAEAEIASLPKAKEKKEISKKIERAMILVSGLGKRTDPATEAFILKTFAQAAEIAKVRGDTDSGEDLNSTVVQVMSTGSPRMKQTLIDSHATLPASDLTSCFQAARKSLSPEKVYEIFSPYLLSNIDDKKKKDAGKIKREALVHALLYRSYFWDDDFDDDDDEEDEKAPVKYPLDPRWLDVALKLKQLDLIAVTLRPGHPVAQAFVLEAYEAKAKKAKHIYDLHEELDCLFKSVHPQANEKLMETLQKFVKKLDYFGYFYGELISQLPKTMIPELEALIPQMSDRGSDMMVDYIQQIRNKP